jgi:hypothetical protein
MELNLNMVAILIAVVVNFFIGFIWFTPLFGKIWGKEMGYDANMKPDPKVMMKGMIFMVIGNSLHGCLRIISQHGSLFLA